MWGFFPPFRQQLPNFNLLPGSVLYIPVFGVQLPSARGCLRHENTLPITAFPSNKLVCPAGSPPYVWNPEQGSSGGPVHLPLTLPGSSQSLRDLLACAWTPRAESELCPPALQAVPLASPGPNGVHTCGSVRLGEGRTWKSRLPVVWAENSGIPNPERSPPTPHLPGPPASPVDSLSASFFPTAWGFLHATYATLSLGHSAFLLPLTPLPRCQGTGAGSHTGTISP